MRKRNKRFSLWLNEKEFDHLEQQAQIAGLKKEPFIRKLILGMEIHPRPPDNITALLRELNHIGNNINQIARKANAFDRVSQDELSEIRKMLFHIYKGVKG